MNLVYGHDDSVAAWAAGRFERFSGCIAALGVVDGEGPLVGAATFHEFNGWNVEVCYWGPRTFSRGIARGIARHAFFTMGARRITCRAARSNRTVKLGLPPMGFRHEGIMRRFYGPNRRDDAIVFGLLREDAGKLLGSMNEP